MHSEIGFFQLLLMESLRGFFRDTSRNSAGFFQSLLSIFRRSFIPRLLQEGFIHNSFQDVSMASQSAPKILFLNPGFLQGFLAKFLQDFRLGLMQKFVERCHEGFLQVSSRNYSKGFY